jgi:integrase
MRKRTGTIIREGDHFVALITLDAGHRKRIPLPAGISEAAAREKAAFYSENAAKIPNEPKAAAIPKGETFAEYFERWLADRDARGFSDVNNERSRLNTHVFPVVVDGVALRDKAIRTITRRDIEMLVSSLDEKVRMRLDEPESAGGASGTTMCRAWATVAKLFDDACHSKNLSLRVRDDDPTDKVKGPDRGIEKAKVYIYPSEFVQFIRSPDVSLKWRRICALCIYLFLRLSELGRLRWADIDLARGIITVHRGWDRYRKREKTTKGGRPRRFAIEPRLLPLLRAMHAEARGAEHVMAFNTDKAAFKLRECLAKAGIERPALYADTITQKNLTFHDLKATGLTWLAVRGDDPLKIQQRGGHTDFATTQRYIREAENLDAADFGEPFPDLSCLVAESFANRSTGGTSGGQAHDVIEDSSVTPSDSMCCAARAARQRCACWRPSPTRSRSGGSSSTWAPAPSRLHGRPHATRPGSRPTSTRLSAPTRQPSRARDVQADAGVCRAQGEWGRGWGMRSPRAPIRGLSSFARPAHRGGLTRAKALAFLTRTRCQAPIGLGFGGCLQLFGGLLSAFTPSASPDTIDAAHSRS